MPTQKTNPDALFVGFRKDKSGRLLEIFIDPKLDQISLQQRRKLISKLSMSVVGFTGSINTLGKLGTSLCEVAGNENSTTRRNFLKAGVLVAGSLGLAACSKEDITPEIEEFGTATPLITGPKELSIPKIGGHAKGTFNSSESKGTIDTLAWSLLTPCSLEPRITIGTESEVTHNFSIPGSYTLELIADNSAGRSIGKHEIKVHPPELPKNKYDIPLAFVANEALSGRGLNQALYTFDVNTMEVTRLFGSKHLFHTINWSPDGEKIVFTDEPEGSTYPITPVPISTYNLLTGVVKKISNNGSGIAWKPAWSPTGEWIAYVDDSRSPNHNTDEVALVRPNGSGQFYIGDKESYSTYCAFGLSWNPDGTHLAGAGVRTNKGYLAIFSDLFSGKPKVDWIPTSEQLERFYDNGDFSEVSKDIFFRSRALGTNGVAWSPNGKKIAYNIVFAEDSEIFGYKVLVVSNADGTGDIETLAVGTTKWGDEEFSRPENPTWSPDGESIYFTAYNFDKQRLYKIDLKTKQKEIVLDDIIVKSVSYYD